MYPKHVLSIHLKMNVFFDNSLFNIAHTISIGERSGEFAAGHHILLSPKITSIA